VRKKKKKKKYKVKKKKKKKKKKNTKLFTDKGQSIQNNKEAHPA
jgi:hypothetical protein